MRNSIIKRLRADLNAIQQLRAEGQTDAYCLVCSDVPQGYFEGHHVDTSVVNEIAWYSRATAFKIASRLNERDRDRLFHVEHLQSVLVKLERQTQDQIGWLCCTTWRPIADLDHMSEPEREQLTGRVIYKLDSRFRGLSHRRMTCLPDLAVVSTTRTLGLRTATHFMVVTE